MWPEQIQSSRQTHRIRYASKFIVSSASSEIQHLNPDRPRDLIRREIQRNSTLWANGEIIAFKKPDMFVNARRFDSNNSKTFPFRLLTFNFSRKKIRKTSSGMSSACFPTKHKYFRMRPTNAPRMLFFLFLGCGLSLSLSVFTENWFEPE